MPIVTCDHCGDEIARAEQGNYEWQDLLEAAVPVFFTHKYCSHAFRATHPEVTMHEELQVFPLYLASNLGTDAKAAGELARDLHRRG